MAYQGPVARIREEIELERAALGLAGEKPTDEASRAIGERVLRARLYTSWSPVVVGMKHYRPWRLGTDMVGPEWFWKGVARVLNDPDSPGLVQVWTRKAHRAWRQQSFPTRSVAEGILLGEIKDAYPW